MFSIEHKKYLKKLKRERIIVRVLQITILALFIIIWQMLADHEMINTFITSSPRKMWSTIVTLHQSNDLYHHIWITTYETLLSFGLATIIGCVVAAILWWNPFIAKVLDPYLTILNSLPKVALGPIIIIWGGAGMKSIIIMALLISVIITIINVSQGFTSTDSNKIKLMQSLHASKSQTFFKLVLPNSFQTIIGALKINISMSLIGVIMGEFLVSKEGLGYLIMYGSQVFNLNLVVAGVVLLAILSAVMYYIIFYIEKRLTK